MQRLVPAPLRPAHLHAETQRDRIERAVPRSWFDGLSRTLKAPTIRGLLALMVIAALFRPFPAAPLAAAAQLTAQASGDDIAREAERVNEGFGGERATFTLLLISAHGDAVERRFTLEMREDNQAGDQSRIEFDWPDNVRGTVLLTHARLDADDDQWLYLPAMGRARRVSGGQRNGAFMGSEFTFEDLSPPLASKFTHTRSPDAEMNGRACYVIERRARSADSGYSRQVLWLERQHLVPQRIEFYNRRNELQKVAHYRDYGAFGRHQRAGVVRMENQQTRRASELRAATRVLDVTLDPQRFRSQTLGR